MTEIVDLDVKQGNKKNSSMPLFPGCNSYPSCEVILIIIIIYVHCTLIVIIKKKI